MKKIYRLLVVLVSVIVLSSCTNTKSDELNNLIQMPKQESPSITGTWRVKEVKSKNDSSKDQIPKVDDLIYIDQNLVAIGDSYAFPPVFSSKYVNLSKYLKSRGIDNKEVDKDKNSVIINASQGQLFSKDFIKQSEISMFYIVNDSMVSLEKVSNKVDSKILNNYSKKASKERMTNPEGEEVAEDQAVTLGVRERIDEGSDYVLYNYYTYLIRIKDDSDISYKKAYNIFINDKEEYWSINTNGNNITNNYDELLAYPVRIKDKMGDSSTKSRYSYKDINLNMRLNYVSNEFISIDYTSLVNDNPIRKYAILETKNLKDGKFLSLQEFTGEEDSDLIFKERVLDEANSNFKNYDEKNIPFDNTNFGIVRNQGQWIFQSSIFTGDGEEFEQNFFPMEIAIGSQMLNKKSNHDTSDSLTRDQVRNINAQFKDYHILSNGKYILIQTPDEILIHKIKDNLIDKNPLFSIPTMNPTTIVSIDEQSASSAETLESAFTNYNKIIEEQR